MKLCALFLCISFFVCNVHTHVSMYPYEPSALSGNAVLIELMFPQYLLNQIQNVALQMIDDFELIFQEHDTVLVEPLNEAYLVNQTHKLYMFVTQFIQEETKTHYYLPDDIEYLIELCGTVGEKLVNAVPFLPSIMDDATERLGLPIVEAKTLLEGFLNKNRQVVCTLDIA